MIIAQDQAAPWVKPIEAFVVVGGCLVHRA